MVYITKIKFYRISLRLIVETTKERNINFIIMIINILVKSADGVLRNLNIQDSATVEELKQAIEEKFEITLGNIVFSGIILSEDEATLTECKIKNKSVVQITQRIHGGYEIGN